MKRIALRLIASAALLFVTTPADAHGPHYGVRIYGGYPAYAAYRPYYGPVYYPPPRVYYPPPYAVYPYPAPVVSGFYGGPGFSFYFGR